MTNRHVEWIKNKTLNRYEIIIVFYSTFDNRGVFGCPLKSELFKIVQRNMFEEVFFRALKLKNMIYEFVAFF